MRNNPHLRNKVDVMTDLVFSWTLCDITNDYHFENHVRKIPDTFLSVDAYLGSFIYPLLEETRANLSSSLDTISSSPFARVKCFQKKGDDLFGIKIDAWRTESTYSVDPYITLPGDILILANGKPETAGDLQRSGQRWTFAEVVRVADDDGVEDDYADDMTRMSFYVTAASGDELRMLKSVYAIYLMNITTHRRIWNALHMSRNLDMINEVSSMTGMEGTGCRSCISRTGLSGNLNIDRFMLDDMNNSQAETVNTILNTIECPHRSTVELIWGPPGTGKTKTTAALIFNLLLLKKRTLVYAPTDVAIKEIASQVVTLVKNAQASLPHTSQMIVFGNKKRLKLHDTETEMIYLDYRVKELAEFFSLSTGWRHNLSAMEGTLVECVSRYHDFLDWQNSDEVHGRPATFLEFFKDKFESAAEPVKRCLNILYYHIPASYLSEDIAQVAISLLTLFDTFRTMLCGEDLDPKKLEKAFSITETDGSWLKSVMDSILVRINLKCVIDPILVRINLKRWECISHLRVLVRSLSELEFPQFTSSESIADFCYHAASLIFCTCSSSFKLHSKVMDPFELLVVDEAAQLKECESVIPLQLPGIRHAILVGDERQLPAMVESKIASSAGFGRSLFERLSSLGHPKHLLDTQYRMHPDISLFPTKHFYQNQISDAPHVRDNSYKKCYLPTPMFGPFTFINVPDGHEEIGQDGRSLLNKDEVAAILIILRELHKVQCKSDGDISIGVISPYAAQVAAITQKLGQTYDNTAGFLAKVNTVDGFQGGEVDVVIISCVRSNARGSIGFLADPRRTNVALTRARYCLWILGNEKTLIKSKSVWEALVHDAKVRQCFFDVGSNKKLYKAIMDVKKENNQLDDLLRGDSMLFKNARWKVLFSDNFLVSFRNLMSLGMKASVLNFLLRLCSGWRSKKINVNIACERSGHLVQKYKVENSYLLCSIDIVKEVRYTQILKVWDVLASEHVPMVVKRLDSIFVAYTAEFIGHCNQKFLEGDLEVPRSWDFPYGLIRERRLDAQAENSLIGNESDDKLYTEHAKVSESLLLMKFYRFTDDVVGYLLSNSQDGELSLPFELTTQEQEIAMFPKTSFILGRSGTGKTTILTMKLFLREKRFHEAMYGSSTYHKDMGRDYNQGPEEEHDCTLHQLFVTVSPKLCFAIKKHVSQLQSFAFGGKFQAEKCSVNNEPDDDVALFKGIPDNFIDVSPDSYPLIITFHKFLMMLDGTVGDSYFYRFPDLRELCGGKYSSSGVDLGLQSLIKAKEVNYEKFHAVYWPRFKDKLTRKLDPSRVFTEIISHIKGGDRSGDGSVGILSRAAYVALSETRASTLCARKRAEIYDIFEDYEKLKMENREFDLADFVNDIHCRIQREAFMVDVVHFVYIDEVQDLTMRQLSLFKYICRNVEEGFVFSGDTAQTIARGIDFRFEDIRLLFYKEFLSRSREMHDMGMEKGQISKSFHLNQNFRTHDGILKLAQSIVDLLYHYFPSAVDVLSPETSLICGEAPVLLVSENDENTIMSIFGNSNKPDRTFVGFGAEQVILVRDNHARNQVLDIVGGRALVLTIIECKGLEFQDVLLYDFFGTSPLRNRWRVIYEYMKGKDLLDSRFLGSSPSFDQEKHDILCSELKQLYVAVTRTRQRLWICENCSDSSKPIFDYWKRLCLVRTRVVDSDLAEVMQVASTPEQWKSQGYKLLQEGNYTMAILCFERSGYVYGEKLAKASSLKADADLKHALSPQEALGLRRRAAEIFEVIGESRSAAECYHMIGEYEKAGRIYMEERMLAQAGDCFHRGGCHALAADAYASGKLFSRCLLVCSEGKLFKVGLQHIESWRSQGLTKTKDMQKLEMDFLEEAALHYHNKKDSKSMMTYVRAFHSISIKREFLTNMICLDELICLEVEQGNMLEAAKIAQMKGDVLLEADLLGKGKYFKRASMLILGYVLSCSLWGNGSKGWPLKVVPEMEEPLQKARELAKSESDALYHYVDLESRILLGKNHSFAEMQNNLGASKACSSVAGEVLCIRSILDLHFHMNVSKFQLKEDSIVSELISTNRMSGDTLFHFWSCWKDLIVKIIRCIQNSEKQEFAEKERRYWMFCLDYLGVREEHKIRESTFSLLYEKSDWCININKNCSRASLASAAERYWYGELMSVGMEVLNKLNAVYQFLIRSPALNFCQSICLIRIFEAASFLLETDFSKIPSHQRKTLQRHIQISSEEYFSRVFPNGWLPVTTNMISLRQSEASNVLLVRNFISNGSLKDRMSNGHMGHIAMVILGSGSLGEEFKMVIGENVNSDSACGALINLLIENVVRRPTVVVILMLCRALEETYNINWRNEKDYMTPTCFMYLLERLLILTSCAEGYFFAAKSSLIEFLVCHHGEFDFGDVSMDDIGSSLQFISHATSELLGDPIGLQDWITRSNVNLKEYFWKFMLKMVLLVCILYLNFGDNSAALFHLLDFNWMPGQLPLEFGSILQRFRSASSRKAKAGILAAELPKVSDTLVLVCLRSDCSGLVIPGAVVLDTRVNKTMDDMVKVLFPVSNHDVVRESSDDIAEEKSVATEEVVVTKEVKFAKNKHKDQVQDDDAPSEKAEKNSESRTKGKKNISKGNKKNGGRKRENVNVTLS